MLRCRASGPTTNLVSYHRIDAVELYFAGGVAPMNLSREGWS